MSNESEVLIPVANAEAIGLGVERRSLGRRIRDPASGFPTTIRIGGRLYVRKSELDAYKARLIRGALSETRKSTPSFGGEAAEVV